MAFEGGWVLGQEGIVVGSEVGIGLINWGVWCCW